MIRGSGGTEHEDEYDKYFAQYRPRQPRHEVSPAPSSYYSAQSSLGRGGGSLTETSHLSSDSSYNTFTRYNIQIRQGLLTCLKCFRGGSVYRSYPGPPPMPRSRSQVSYVTKLLYKLSQLL